MTGKSVLVTGGAGYIGSHVCKALHQAGFQPIVLDNLCSGNREAVKWGPFEEGDIRDRSFVRSVLKKYSPIAIMHFAALIQVGESTSKPADYYHTNVYGTWCLLEEARLEGIRHIVFSSTAAVYGLPKEIPVKEHAELLPINPYGQSKLATEKMIEDYSSPYSLSFAILRYFNAAGADPDCEIGSAYKIDTHIIPLLMQVASGRLAHIKLFGQDYDTPDGTAIRDYVHVSDLAEAHILALNHILEGKGNLVCNIGTSAGYSVQRVIDVVREITEKEIPVEVCARRAGDPAQLVAASSKASETLNWKPRYSDLNTIAETAWRWEQLKSSNAQTK